MNLTSFVVFISLDSFIDNSIDQFLFEKSIFEFGTIIANQLMKTFREKEGVLGDTSSYNIWQWKIFHYYEFCSFPSDFNLFIFIIYKIYTFIKCVILYGILSAFASITFHIGTISISAVYIVIGIFNNILS